jgi:hypothetical protein
METGTWVKKVLKELAMVEWFILLLGIYRVLDPYMIQGR